MTKVMIGDPSRFAIEYELDAAHMKDPEAAFWQFGCVRYWIGRESVGQLETATLCTLVAESKSIASGRGKRVDRSLCAMGADEVARFITRVLYEDYGQSDVEIAADSRQYSEFEVSPGIDVFVPWRIILIDCDDAARVIWYRKREGPVREFQLRLGEYEDVVETFVSCLERKTAVT